MTWRTYLGIACSGSEFFFASLSLFPRRKTVTLLFVPSVSKLDFLFWRSQTSRSSAYHSSFVLRRSWVPNMTGFFYGFAQSILISLTKPQVSQNIHSEKKLVHKFCIVCSLLKLKYRKIENVTQHVSWGSWLSRYKSLSNKTR